ncbi:MAG: hypothetical protein KKF62_18480 [Bacteroidetes bacterium]|nr:hypothetical protein [Bacteroidota bacterium]MBU1114371.1 hypothetical protein [Bacteroidota bacterium]MBU1798334.1 hypothetical protein [Bacteroidota bacterium]
MNGTIDNNYILNESGFTIGELKISHTRNVNITNKYTSGNENTNEILVLKRVIELLESTIEDKNKIIAGYERLMIGRNRGEMIKARGLNGI